MAEAGVYSRNLFDLLDDENRDTSVQAPAPKQAKDAKVEAAKPAPAEAAAAKKDDTRLVAGHRKDARSARSRRWGQSGRGRAAAARRHFFFLPGSRSPEAPRTCGRTPRLDSFLCASWTADAGGRAGCVAERR